MAAPVFEVEDMIELIQNSWREGTGTTLTIETIKKFFKNSIRHVETIDYPKNNEYTFTGDDVEFTTTPSNISMILYAYRTLADLQRALVNGDLVDGKFVSWRSGMDSVNTLAAGDIKDKIRLDFKKQYEDALIKAKLRGHTPVMIDLYEEDE